MPEEAAAASRGVCSQPGCTVGAGRRKRSVSSHKNLRRSTTPLSNDTAQQICDAYIDTYLNRVQRTPSQRDIHYNATIASARDMCLFDVTANDASVGSEESSPAKDHKLICF